MLTNQVLNDTEKTNLKRFIRIIGVFESKMSVKGLVIILFAGIVRENVTNLRGYLTLE